MSVLSRVRAYPLGGGLVAGSVAWLLGIAVSYAAVVVFLESPDSDPSVSADPTGSMGDLGPETVRQLAQLPFELGGMLYFNAHFVQTQVDVILFAQSFDLLGTLGGPWSALYLLPPVALTLAGAALVRYSPPTDARDAAGTGATVVAGYLVMVAISTQVFTLSIGFRSTISVAISIGPGVGIALFLAGLVYPLAFGALGGFLAWKLGGARAAPVPSPEYDVTRGPPRDDRGPYDRDRDDARTGDRREGRDAAVDRAETRGDRRPGVETARGPGSVDGRSGGDRGVRDRGDGDGRDSGDRDDRDGGDRDGRDGGDRRR